MAEFRRDAVPSCLADSGAEALRVSSLRAEARYRIHSTTMRQTYIVRVYLNAFVDRLTGGADAVEREGKGSSASVSISNIRCLDADDTVFFCNRDTFSDISFGCILCVTPVLKLRVPASYRLYADSLASYTSR